MAESVKQKYEWLIIFLVYNNNYYDLKKQDTTDYYTMDEQTRYIRNQIRYTRYNKNVKTVMVEVNIKTHFKKDDPSVVTKITSSLSMLYKKKGTWLSAIEGIWRRSDTIDTMTTQESLSRILSFLNDRYKAEKHMIVTAGHGSVTGINYFMPLRIKSTRNSQTNKLLKQEMDLSTKVEKETESITLEYTNPELLFLSNKEINDSIKAVFGKIDVLVMYNCIMQSVFTQYEFKDTVNWLVAPLSGISIPGFNYENILNEISVNEKIEGKQVAELFINSIRAGNSYSLHKADIEGTWKLAAVEINNDWLCRVQKDFEGFFTAMKNHYQTDSYIISTLNGVVRHLFSFSIHCLQPVHLFDLSCYLHSLKDNIKNNTSATGLIIAIDTLLDSLSTNPQTQYIFQGKDFYYVAKDIKHYETTGSNFEKISNVSFLFPIEKPGGTLFNQVFDAAIDNNKQLVNPSFVSLNYKFVINKLHAFLPFGVG